MSEYDESDTYSSSGVSDYSDDLDPPWQEGITQDGDIFYVEQDLQELAPQQYVNLDRSPQFTREDDNIHDNNLHGTASNSNTGPGNNTKWQPGVNLKTVFISVNSALTYNQGASLLKDMLGIISLHSKTDRGQHFGKHVDDRHLVVNAMLPGGPAFQSEAVEIGDTLLAVSDVAVYHSNIEQVLQRIPHRMELKLTIQHENQSSPFNSINSRERERTSFPVSLHTLTRPSQPESYQLETIFNAVLYLTLNVGSETAQGEEDIRYVYPASDNPGIRKLRSIRGVFTTLADVTSDAFKSDVISSSLFINNELIHCVYFHYESEVLIICVPAQTCPLSSAHNVLTKTVRLLKFMFGSLTQAFGERNWSRLNDMFQLLFKSSIWSVDSPKFGLAQSVDGIRSVIVDKEIVAGIDITLSELEAADFDDGFHSQGLSRRLFSVLGSCLFYKGYLVASHLCTEDLNDVWIYSQVYSLLGTLRTGQLLIWREVFPTRNQHSENIESGDFKETNGRYFYLLVGLRHCLLCILLGSGGCTVPMAGRASPPPLYINHAKAAILHLENINITRKLDEHLFGQSVPQLSSADALAKKSGSFLFGTGSTPSNKPPYGSDPSTNQGSVKLSMASHPDSTKDSTGKQVNNAPEGNRSLLNRLGSPKLDSKNLSKGVKSISSTFTIGKLREALPLTEQYSRLTSGSNNTLFHYVNFDTISGMLLTAQEENKSVLHGPFHQCVLESFRYNALVLHERLSSHSTKYHNKKVIEEGTLFYCNFPDGSSTGNKKATSYVQYWVIGRLVMKPKQSEFYVCFHDHVKEDVKEMAFRLGFCMNV